MPSTSSLGRRRTRADRSTARRTRRVPEPRPVGRFSRRRAHPQQAGGNAEAAHRCATLLHLANVAIRTGRKLKYDPVKEQFIGDAAANRFVDVPYRAPWRLEG